MEERFGSVTRSLRSSAANVLRVFRRKSKTVACINRLLKCTVKVYTCPICRSQPPVVLFREPQNTQNTQKMMGII